MNRAAWREAWRWQRHEAGVPWWKRAGVALAFTALLVVAGWGKAGTGWLVAGFSVAWWGLVAVGIRQDWQEARLRVERSEEAE